MPTNRTSLVVAALVIGQATLSNATAQTEARFRAKVETADAAAKVELAEFERSKVFINGAVEMTMAGIRGLHRGLDMEIKLLEEFAAELKTFRSPEVYSACVDNLAMSPEAQRIAMRVGALPENATAEQAQNALTKMGEDMQALMKTKCGADVNEEWPQHKRDERLKTIVSRAAAATGPVSDTTRGRGGPAPEDEFFDLADQQRAMTDVEYKVWQERVEAYCAYKKLKKGKMNVTPGDGYGYGFAASFLNPAAGKKVAWLFTAEEVVLADAECTELVLKIGKIQEIIEMAPINIRGRRR